MAQKTVLEVTPRTVLGKANKHLRRQGFIPGNIYGHEEEPMPIQIAATELERLRRQHGTRSVLSLQLPSGPEQTVLMRHMQHSPTTGGIVHVDFSRVNLADRLEMKVPMNFVGDAPGVKIHGGVLLHLVESLTIECAASDIVESLDVDISSLTEIDSTLHASDVKLPATYKLVTDAEEPIVKVSAPRVEEAATAEAAVATPEKPATSGAAE